MKSYELTKKGIRININSLDSTISKMISTLKNDIDKSDKIIKIYIEINTIDKNECSITYTDDQYNYLCKFIDKYGIYDEYKCTGGWMSRTNFILFIIDLKNKVKEIMNIDIFSDIDLIEIDWDDLYDFFTEFNLPYKVRYLGNKMSTPYSIDRI